MHLVFENLVKNLVHLWTGTFKKMDHHDQPYVLRPTVWNAIGAASAASGSTIPSSFRSRPQNVAEEKYAMTAETWVFWFSYLGPILLEGQFLNNKLVELINLCIQFDIPQNDIHCIREGFQTWVVNYESLYYQNTPNWLPTCPTTVHTLLHIADGIEQMGPMWVYWAFPMEQYCLKLSRAITSRRFPWSNLSNRVTATAQLTEIGQRYGCLQEISFKKRLQDDNYDKEYVLVWPRKEQPKLGPGLVTKLISALSTRYSKKAKGIPMKTMRSLCSMKNVVSWGWLRRLGCGDLMHAADTTTSTAPDRRDATFICYQALADRNIQLRDKRSEFDLKMYFGQLKGIYMVQVPPSKDLGLKTLDTVVFAEVAMCKDVTAHSSLNIHYYRKLGGTEIVDIMTIQCLVGQILWKGRWAIINRSGTLAQALVADDLSDYE
ncbi:hypothetical protein FA15DRAFT_682829 [Coprinopsis marcescibilis]|uniref:DUF4218 domain-containing protein n=1 Tax=Coprinopsis marcescibilis TaxID=230819 RepID=A0A5C3KIS9_COPMA|nr:hypothetical protein FA15DRAFT_682829 [Coprinopsis marcescibilis]